MVRPAHFGYNEETAASNLFQSRAEQWTPEQVEAAALAEFDEFVRRLRTARVTVHVWEDRPEPRKTDAVFPNNWVTFHADGTVITYPMLSETRRLERDEELLDKLAERFVIKKRIHLEEYEKHGKFLEGTGSMILDRAHRLAYACVSPRTHPELLEDFCHQMDYKPVLFTAIDDKGVEIYHTNVMMALGEAFVVICLESIAKSEDRRKLLRHFSVTGKEVIEISFEQMKAFAGNMLQVRNDRGEPMVIMSDRAYQSLNTEQIRRLERHATIFHSPIKVIETLGGGSVRCMMAEVFLPLK